MSTMDWPSAAVRPTRSTRPAPGNRLDNAHAANRGGQTDKQTANSRNHPWTMDWWSRRIFVGAFALLALVPSVRGQDLYFTSPQRPDWTTTHTLLPLIFFCVTFPVYLTSAILLWRRRSNYPIAGRGAVYLLATNAALLMTAPLATVASIAYPGGVPCGLVFLIASTSVLPLSFTYMARAWILVFRLEIQNYIADLHLAESELAAKNAKITPQSDGRRMEKHDESTAAAAAEHAQPQTQYVRTSATVTSTVTTTTTTVTTIPARGQVSATHRVHESPKAQPMTEQHRSRVTRAASPEEGDGIETIELDPRKASIFHSSSSHPTHHHRHSSDLAAISSTIAADAVTPIPSDRSNVVSPSHVVQPPQPMQPLGISKIEEEASGRRSPWTKTMVGHVSEKYMQPTTSKILVAPASEQSVMKIPRGASSPSNGSTVVTIRTEVPSNNRVDVARVRGIWFIQHRHLIEARWLFAFFGTVSALFFFLAVMVFLVQDDPDVRQVNEDMYDSGATNNPHYYTRSQLHPDEILYAAPCQLSTGKMLFVQFTIVGLLTPLIIWLVLRLRKNARRSAMRQRYLEAKGVGAQSQQSASSLAHLRASHPNDESAVKQELCWIAVVALYICIAYPLFSLFAKPYILFDVLIPLAAIELVTLAHPLYVAWRLARDHRAFLVQQRMNSLKGGTGYAKLLHHRPYYRLKFILRSSHTYPALLRFLEKEHSSENALFIREVREYEKACRVLEAKISTWPQHGVEEDFGAAVDGARATLLIGSTKAGKAIPKSPFLTATAHGGTAAHQPGGGERGSLIVPTAASRIGRASAGVSELVPNLQRGVSLPGSVVRCVNDEPDDGITELNLEEEFQSGAMSGATSPVINSGYASPMAISPQSSPSAALSSNFSMNFFTPASTSPPIYVRAASGSNQAQATSSGSTPVYGSHTGGTPAQGPAAAKSQGGTPTSNSSRPPRSDASPAFGSLHHASQAHRVRTNAANSQLMRGKDAEDMVNTATGTSRIGGASRQNPIPPRPTLAVGAAMGQHKSPSMPPQMLSPPSKPAGSPTSASHRQQQSMGAMVSNVTSSKLSRQMFSLAELKTVHHDARAVKARCVRIHEMYLRPSAPLQINISDDLAQLIAGQVESVRAWNPSPMKEDGSYEEITKDSLLPNPPPFALSTVYHQCAMTVFDLVQKDSFRRFVLTDDFLSLLAAADDIELRKQQAQESLEAQTRAVMAEAVFSIRSRAIEAGATDDGLGQKTDGMHVLDGGLPGSRDDEDDQEGSSASGIGRDQSLHPDHSRRSHRRASHMHQQSKFISPMMDHPQMSFLDAPPLAGAELTTNPLAAGGGTSAPSSSPGSRRGSLKASPFISAKPSPPASSHPSPAVIALNAHRPRPALHHPVEVIDLASPDRPRRAPLAVSIATEGEWTIQPQQGFVPQLSPSGMDPGPLLNDKLSAAAAAVASGATYSPLMRPVARAASLRRALTGRTQKSVDISPLQTPRSSREDSNNLPIAYLSNVPLPSAPL